MPSNLLMLDGFGNYSTASASQRSKWSSQGGSITSVSQTGTGKALLDGNASKVLPSTYPVLSTGVRRLLNGAGSIISYTNSNLDAVLSVTSTLNLKLILQTPSAPLGSGAPVITSSYSLGSFGVVYHFQLYLSMIPTTSGNPYGVDWIYDVLVNGISRFSGTTTSPVQGGTGGGAACIFKTFNVFSNDGLGSWLGDVWCADGELLGVGRVRQFFPRAAGSRTNWTPRTGSNFSEVNAHIATDAEYNSSLVPGDIDEYLMDQLTGPNGTIKGYQGVWRCQSAGPGTSSIQGIYRNGAGTEINATCGAFAPSLSNFQFFIDPNRKSVFTSADLTQTEFNSMEVGIQR